MLLSDTDAGLVFCACSTCGSRNPKLSVLTVCWLGISAEETERIINRMGTLGLVQIEKNMGEGS